MHFFLYILLYFILISNKSFARKIEIKCPSHCKCDIFERLKRASCVHKNLAVIESNLPRQTQLLDLSYNQISHLDKQIFIEHKLLSLKLLNISHNKVSQIHMNAFDGLKKLKSLDLSFNAIQYILQNWFWGLKSLEELYLRGNSFRKLDDELFDSKTLKRLDLSYCTISYVGNNAFLNLPNLESLDLSGNNLIQLNVAVIRPLKNLNILNVQNNTISCDQVLTNLANYTLQNGIRFEDPCKKKISDSDKFQRMINIAELDDEKNTWIYEEDEDTNFNNKTGINMTCYDTRSDKSLLQEIVDLSPILSILIPLIYGIAVGILIGCTVHGYSSRKKGNVEESTYISYDQVGDTHLRRRSRFSHAFRREEDQQSLPMQEWGLSESTPVLYRKNQVRL